MTNDELLHGICKGTPLRLIETDDRVYFRSARFSPHADEVLATVADENGGLYSFAAAELSREEDEDY